MYAMSERNDRLQSYANIWTQKSDRYRQRKKKEGEEKKVEAGPEVSDE